MKCLAFPEMNISVLPYGIVSTGSFQKTDDGEQNTDLSVIFPLLTSVFRPLEEDFPRDCPRILHGVPRYS